MNNPSFRKYRFLFPVAAIAFLALITFAVYGLWNGVLADVVAVKTITYWQAMGILVLAKLLFGGLPGRGGRFGPPWRYRMMAKRWASLAPEEQERLRDEMRHRFGDWPRPPWCDDPPEKPGEPAKP